MLRVARYTLAAASISLALARCQDVTGPNSAARPPRTGLVMSGVAESTAPLILHTVPPQTTDPEITWAPSANPQLADHYVWLNPSVRGNPKLLVFMPGTGNQPFQWSQDRKSTRLNSSHVRISYAVFCLKKKTRTLRNHTHLLTAL